MYYHLEAKNMILITTELDTLQVHKVALHMLCIEIMQK